MQVPQTRPTGPTLPTHLAFVVQFAAETVGEPGQFVGRVEHVVSGRPSASTRGKSCWRS